MLDWAMKRPKPCPAESTLRLLSGRWRLAILRALSRRPVRFGALSRAVPGVSRQMLSVSLKALERDGLVCRKDFVGAQKQRLLHVAYAMTPLGRSLRPVVAGLHAWGRKRRASPKGVGKPGRWP